jgi:pyruvate dehydrogenase E1 component alpha subunit
VVEDNGYAEATASSYSVGGTQVGRGQGFGLPSVEVDGSDFFAVYETAGEAIARARSGGGASLIHSRVLRYFGHFEGDATTYRGPGEVADYKAAKDPLMQFRRRVIEASLLKPGELDAIDADVKASIARAAAYAKVAPMPLASALTTDVYNRY